MNVLLFPVGSAGDVNPHIWLGRGLREQGHEVTLFTGGPFQTQAEQAGLRFVQVGSPDDYEAFLRDPDLWHPRRGTERVFDMVGRFALAAARQLEQATIPGRTVILSSILGLPARMVREKHRVPLLTIHLQPSCLVSAEDCPVIPGFGWMRHLPPFALRFLFEKMPDRTLAMLGPAFVQGCRDFGIDPPARIFPDWWHSPDGVVCLYPEWFAPRPGDAPAHLAYASFPREDLSRETPLAPDLLEWLSHGPAPLVLTPGSAMRHARELVEAFTNACSLLGRRGLVVTPFPENLPTRLPDLVHRVPSAPFGPLFARSRLVVHHGGIGTLSHALAAGVPQLVTPFGHDQFDNALRLRRLGLGSELGVRTLRARPLARMIEQMLADEGLAGRCAAAAQRLHGENPLNEVIRRVEQLGEG
jgi:UDP:flavonoid glycosyltransferase YjiC (YdhE family)